MCGDMYGPATLIGCWNARATAEIARAAATADARERDENVLKLVKPLS